MANQESSGANVTKIASKVLPDAGVSKTAKSLAGSALAQSRTEKESSKATARAAAKALNDGRTSKTTKSLAGSVLTKKTSKK